MKNTTLIHKKLRLRISSLLTLTMIALTLTSCGSEAAPVSAPDGGTTAQGESASFNAENTQSKLPSESHLRAFTTVQDLESADFTPIGAQEVPRNPFPDLSVPTHVTKAEDTYFIVDCYHNQVIYHDNLTDPLTDWQILTNEIDKGHTIASDGLVYLVDDTEGNRILVFEKKEGVFYHTQTLDEVGNRPHYIVYHAPTDTFYVWSSMNGEMYLCRHDPDDPRMYLTEIRTVNALKETYVRSFTIEGSDIYFVSGISGAPAILKVDLSTFTVLETYPVPEEIAGMVQLTFAEGNCYITVSTDNTGNQDYATLLRAADLKDLADGNYEDIYETFIGGGTPYYISQINNTYYLTEHRLPGHAVWKFDITPDGIAGVEAIY